MKLQQFFNTEKLNRQWVVYPGLSVYVRRQYVPIDRVFRKYLTLANINATRPGNGAYTKLLAELYQILPTEFYGIYVESVLEPRFAEFHLKRQTGWVEVKQGLTTSLRWDRPAKSAT